MKNLDELYDMVPTEQKEDAKNILDGIKKKIRQNEEDVLIARSKTQQALTKAQEAIDSRTAIKMKNREIANLHGIEDGEDILEGIKVKFNEKKDNENNIEKKENIRLREEIDNFKKEKIVWGEQEKLYQEKEKGYILEKEILNILPKYDVKVGAVKYVTEDVRKKATIVDGKVAFLNSDGSNLRIDMQDANIDLIVKSMRENEVNCKESMFFDNVLPEKSGSERNEGGEVENTDKFFDTPEPQY